jgi:hypothetical protein
LTEAAAPRVVPKKVGDETLVRLSVADQPLSLAGARSGWLAASVLTKAAIVARDSRASAPSRGAAARDAERME